MNTLYKLKNINLNYLLNGNNIKILKNINFEIKKNERVAIIGESGSGKTSLLMLMSGLESPTNGSIVFDKEDLSKINEKRTTEIRRKKIGLIFQQFFLIPNYTALENVMFPMQINKIKNEKEKATLILSEIGLNHCKDNQYEINQNQLVIISNLSKFYSKNNKKNFFKKILKKKNKKIGFYLSGGVGVGKTMILNFFFEIFNEKKLRLHFNEFMINFHNFVFENKKNKEENNIDNFVKKLKTQAKLLYFDEFQVTNIVDAMILGKLFKKIFEENMQVIFSSNIRINDLYKDGLQRDQFLPFIKILRDHSYENELVIQEDYRKDQKNFKRFF